MHTAVIHLSLSFTRAVGTHQEKCRHVRVLLCSSTPVWSASFIFVVLLRPHRRRRCCRSLLFMFGSFLLPPVGLYLIWSRPGLPCVCVCTLVPGHELRSVRVEIVLFCSGVALFSYSSLTRVRALALACGLYLASVPLAFSSRSLRAQQEMAVMVEFHRGTGAPCLPPIHARLHAFLCTAFLSTCIGFLSHVPLRVEISSTVTCAALPVLRRIVRHLVLPE